MKFLAILFLFTSYSLFGQGYAQSEKLGKEDGIKGFKLGAIYANKTKGLNKIQDLATAWSEEKNNEYTVTAAYLLNPKTVGLATYYGQKVKRIELFVNDLDVYDENGDEVENSFVLNSIVVFIKTPKTEKELKDFYAKITADYDPMKDSRNTFGENNEDFFLWISSTRCGAMMRLRHIFNLDDAPEFLPLIFTGSCGG